MQAYGREDIKEQALYAVWSALAWSDGLPIEVHAYTDDATWLAPLRDRVRTRVLTPAEIRAWRGPHDFVHRLKAEMIRDQVRRFPGGKLLYVDADVAFRGALRPIFERLAPGAAVLHVKEYDIPSHPGKQMRRFRRRMKKVRVRGTPPDVGHAMWNAGVIGLDASQFPLIEAWLALIDEVYPQWPYWIHEQWAISHLLERSGNVSAADDVVLHYWVQKDEAVAAIRTELELLRRRPLPEALEHLRAHPLVLPPPITPAVTLGERIARVFRRA
jgi:hypothetical protein